MRGIGRSRKSTNRRVPRSRKLAPHPRTNFAGQGQTSISRGKRSGDAERASLCFGNWPNPAMFSICSKAPLVRPPSASQKQTDAAPPPSWQLLSQLLFPPWYRLLLAKKFGNGEGKKSAKLLNRDLAEFARET